jgi:hypothetical protein
MFEGLMKRIAAISVSRYKSRMAVNAHKVPRRALVSKGENTEKRQKATGRRQKTATRLLRRGVLLAAYSLQPDAVFTDHSNKKLTYTSGHFLVPSFLCPEP